ncbi:MAG: helix-turn-helix transcriptional regulator [Leptospiraceae bacterium]|nr:helix-turn-helix transcriptional regulator [Leptospiraceae bacterium]MCB1317757.1 helix-turn-helix transcriptional regulator [Leptospiraceae bacterium]
MRKVKRIRSQAESRAYLHPVRMQIVDLLRQEALTVSQVAVRLNVHPANLTHHFRKLQNAGLIKLVEERDIGRVVEKYYRSVAERFEVRPGDVDAPGTAHKALGLLKNDLDAAVTSVASAETEVLCLLARAQISTRQFRTFAKRLEKLVAEFGKSGTLDGRQYTLNIALYPAGQRKEI